MPSPFPGMNPYLEQTDVWQDFHGSIIPAIRDSLTPMVRPNYIVKVEEHLFIHEPPAESLVLFWRSDVRLARPKDSHESSGATATITSPLMARIPVVDFEKHLFLEIRDRQDRDLITVIEILSPANKKPGADREQYLAKRARVLRSEANFVEITLLRGGPRMPIEDAKECPYSILVSRVEDRPNVNYWPIELREPLPKTPIPLRAPHRFFELDLQSVLHGVYDRAGYQDYIYQETPEPPLSPEDAAWAASLLGAKV